MSTAVTDRGITPEAYAAFLAAREEPGWLSDLRTRAWKSFRRLPWPERSQEQWRRTDLRGFRLDRFEFPPAPDPGAVMPRPLLGLGLRLAGSMATLNGRASRVQLDAGLARRGVLFGNLETLVRRHGDLLRPHLFARAFEAGYDKLAALHAACFGGGTLLYVPRGVAIDSPLYTLAVLSDGGVDLGHTLIVLEDGAEATVLAETASTAETGKGLHCGGVELLLAPGARLRYAQLQNWGPGVWHFAHQHALLEGGASLQWTAAALGSRLAKVNQRVALLGSGGTAQLDGVMFADGRQHLAYHTLQQHQAPDCSSDLLYRGALQGRSQVVWRGMIKVAPDAQKTDAYQRNDNLILSPEARADSIPGLEIQADDVRCSHGATAGRVDEEQIFYANTRGLRRQEALRMIVLGFFQQAFDRMPVQSVRAALAQAIRGRVEK